MQRKTRQLWRIFAYMPFLSKISYVFNERRVALILHCYVVSGGRGTFLLR